MAELYTLSVATRRGATLQLIYDCEDRARAAYAALNPQSPGGDFSDRGLPPPEMPTRVEVSDSFGTVATFTVSELSMVWLSELGREAEGKKELALAQARANASLNRAAQADPMLRQVAPAMAPSSQLLGAKRG